MTKLKVKELAELYFVNEGSLKKSYKSLRSMITNICDSFIGDKMVDEVTMQDIMRFRNHMSLKLGEGTVNRHHTIGTRLFNYAYELNDENKADYALPVKNPWSKVKKTSEDILARKVVLSPDHLKIFLDLLETDDAKMIVLMAVHTGYRRKDLKNLTRENINFSTNTLEIRQAKTGKPVVTPINSVIKKIIGKSDTNRILNFRNFRRVFERARNTAVKEFHFPPFRFSDLRRTFARTLLEHQVDIATVSTLLGHTSIRMTQRYCPTNPQALRLAEEKIEKIFKSAA